MLVSSPEGSKAYAEKAVAVLKGLGTDSGYLLGPERKLGVM